MKRIGIVICFFTILSASGFAQEVTVKEKSTKEKAKRAKVEIRVKEGVANPVIIIDGKEYDYEIIELIDKNKIESITVVKGEQALKEYNAPDGVIIIESKKEWQSEIKIKKNDGDSTIVIRGRSKLDLSETEGKPMIIIDGVTKDREALEKLSVDDIESVTVLKDDKAKKKYDTESGVIIIETKKK